ncbi:hypothetical protein DYB32_004005 [Aphanomyces invadans]|uniref:Mitochondrial pyruvate carrier n=1 Tax=Aphanomyces invadans TaxID=157072 RepID=A0A3R6VCB3_9STRA|nr:hypothetical protein DYB32_004005 [Aphanomyces invadans]
MSFAGRFKAFINHPTGPKTTHFWGPVANWGFVAAAVRACLTWTTLSRLGDVVAMAVYSLIFMRFAWMVQPRNYLLLACHASNETAQLYQLQRALAHKWTSPASV